MSGMETFALGPAEVAAVIGEACLTEIRAFKPGNVSLASPGHGMSARDFIASADATASVIASQMSAEGVHGTLSVALPFSGASGALK